MKKLLILLAVAALAFSCTSQDPYGYSIKDNKIVYNVPPRPADQQSMLGFRAEPIEHVRIGLVGLGDRGTGAVHRFPYLEDASLVALCDLYQDRVDRAQSILEQHGAPRAIHEFTGEEGYKQLCELDDVDLVYLAVPWQLHTPIAVYAMEHGKHVAIERRHDDVIHIDGDPVMMPARVVIENVRKGIRILVPQSLPDDV